MPSSGSDRVVTVSDCVVCGFPAGDVIVTSQGGVCGDCYRAIVAELSSAIPGVADVLRALGSDR